MNGFPTAPSKSIPLYQHDQLPPFSSSKRPSTEQQQQMPSELQDVIFYYQSQPELLRLILQSKLEEDKRRAEEAKLRSKELDLIMLQQKTTTPLPPPSTSANDNEDPRMMTPPTTASARHSSMDMDPNAFTTARRPSLLHMTSSSPMPPTSTGPTAFTPVVSHVEEHHSPHVTNNKIVTSCASSLSSSSMPATPNTAGSGIFQQQQQPPVYSMEKTPTATTLSPLMDDHGIYTLPSGSNNHHTNTPPPPPPPSYHPLPAIRRYDPYFAPQQRPRRRREMQAITKIVETREYPYLDGYSWKNNGNTVQKKTGNKSVYYKCSNSIRGCPVNKTVTWKGNDEYLIKYRGEHLPDCSRVHQQQQQQPHHASLPM